MLKGEISFKNWLYADLQDEYQPTKLWLIRIFMTTQDQLQKLNDERFHFELEFLFVNCPIVLMKGFRFFFK